MRTNDNKAVEAYGAKGLKSAAWRKTFKSWAAYEAWLERQGGNVEVYGVRPLADH